MRNNILFVTTDMISMRDLPEAFAQEGYNVLEMNKNVSAQSYIESEVELLKQAIVNNNINYVITYDFIECVSKACYSTGCQYISWVYDNPQKELFFDCVLFPTNNIFVFDQKQKQDLEQIGVKNVHHAPLAISEMKVLKALEDKPKNYISDISFVGQLYGISFLGDIMSKASSKVQDDLMEVIERFFINWNENDDFYGSASDELIDFLDRYENYKLKTEAPLMKTSQYYEAAFLARILAREERIAILNELSNVYKVNLYTRDTDLDGINPTVNIIGGVGYDKAVYRVYRDSKINLNITLHCITSGLSQRVFDVMAAGGFLVTNYQKEVEEFFTIGEDLVVYHNYQELKQIVDYYLEHEEEREAIARSGQKKVMEKHTYRLAVEDIMKKMEKL